MSKTQGFIAALLVLVIGAAAFTACGGDDDDDTGGSSNTTAASATGQATNTGPAGTGDAVATSAAATTAAAVGTQPAGGGLTADDACDLMTKSEVEDALGESIQEPVPLEVIDAPVSAGVTAAVGGCGYTSESYASSISVSYWHAPGHDDAVQAMIELACSGKESISGLGDQACWYDEQHAEIQLAIGGNFLDMFATMSGDASDVLTTLAEKAAGRMQ